MAGRGASKHEAVFRAAKEAFVTLGYAGASMDDVARIAGVTKATVYAHAGSKAELFRLTVREMTALAAGGIEPVDRDAPPREALARFLARFLERSSWEGAVALQRTVLGAHADFPELGALMIGTVLDHAVNEVAAYLAERGEAGAEPAAAMLLEAATGARRTRILFGAAPPLPHRPEPGMPQDGAMDEAISTAVGTFCRQRGW